MVEVLYDFDKNLLSKNLINLSGSLVLITSESCMVDQDTQSKLKYIENIEEIKADGKYFFRTSSELLRGLVFGKCVNLNPKVKIYTSRPELVRRVLPSFRGCRAWPDSENLGNFMGEESKNKFCIPAKAYSAHQNPPPATNFFDSPNKSFQIKFAENPITQRISNNGLGTVKSSPMSQQVYDSPPAVIFDKQKSESKPEVVYKDFPLKNVEINEKPVVEKVVYKANLPKKNIEFSKDDQELNSKLNKIVNTEEFKKIKKFKDLYMIVHDNFFKAGDENLKEILDNIKDIVMAILNTKVLIIEDGMKIDLFANNFWDANLKYSYS